MSKVIYFSAVVPEQGKSMADENERYGDIIRRAIAAGPGATVPVDHDVVQGFSMPGDPALLQEFVTKSLLPQPGGYMTGSLDLPPVTKIGLDAAYVLCADDVAPRTSRHRVRGAARRRPAGRARQSHGAADTAGRRGRRLLLPALNGSAARTARRAPGRSIPALDPRHG